MNAVSILGVVAAFSVLFLAAICFCAEKGIHPLRRAMRQFRRIPIFGKLLIAIVVGGWIAFGGSKNDPTNSPPLGMMGPPMTMVGQSPNVLITEAETNAGYRVEAIVEGDGIAPLVNATTNDLWRLRGGMNDARRMENGKWKAANSSGDDSGPHWYFPYRDTFTDGLTVFANGEFRPNAKTTYFPKPFDAVLSLVPQGKWGQIANGGPSLFSHELTPSNSLMLSWQNALYNRDANCPTNFQAELLADGRFVYRYPDHTVQYAPVFSFDWDGDGLENTVDPDPFVAGPDAHGTNVEWYNNVCSNVYSATEVDGEIVLSPRNAGVNTNAYYFVDVVVECGPAPVSFMADGPSRLGNPVIVAKAGETNHVPLLIGANYSITSSVPFSIMSTTNMVQIVENGSARNDYSVSWPVRASFYAIDDGGISLEIENDMHEKLCGVFSWGKACCLVANGRFAEYVCSDCGCGGCHAQVDYVYEKYGIAFVEESGCGCAEHNVNYYEADTNAIETVYGASLSCYFDKRAVIFEYDYMGTPTNLVHGGSTTSRFVVVAYGGPLGGTLTFVPHNVEFLSTCDGGSILRESVDILPGRTYLCDIPYVGVQASGSADDVWVEARFREIGSGDDLVKTASTTVINVDITSPKEAPDNPSGHRHEFGIGETMKVQQQPGCPVVSFLTTDATVVQSNNQFSVSWGVNDVDHNFSICTRGVTYSPRVSVIKPSGIVGTNHWSHVTESTNHISGALYLTQGFVVLPTTVCFDGLAIEEVPCNDVIEPTGYFTRLPTNGVFHLSHTREAGAGIWVDVDSDNRVGGSSLYDRAGVGSVLPHITPSGSTTNDNNVAWMSGRKEWRIQYGWQRRSIGERSQDDPIGIFYETSQVFTMSSDGDYKVEKLGHSSERKFDGRIFTDGELDSVATSACIR